MFRVYFIGKSGNVRADVWHGSLGTISGRLRDIGAISALIKKPDSMGFVAKWFPNKGIVKLRKSA